MQAKREGRLTFSVPLFGFRMHTHAIFLPSGENYSNARMGNASPVLFYFCHWHNYLYLHVSFKLVDLGELHKMTGSGKAGAQAELWIFFGTCLDSSCRWNY